MADEVADEMADEMADEVADEEYRGATRRALRVLPPDTACPFVKSISF
jgi:hypothetical protein